MPYRTNADLPQSVQAHLPDHAQDIYREITLMPRMRESPARRKRHNGLRGLP